MSTSLGKQIKELLRERGLSQKELAARTGLTQAAISRYVNGTREPRASTLASIADALDVSVDTLLKVMLYATPAELDDAVRIVIAHADELDSAQRKSLLCALVDTDGN